MKNVKNNFLFLCFGIVVGIVLSLTLHKRIDQPFGEVPDSASATSIDYAKQVKAMEQEYSIRQDSLQQLGDSLSTALRTTKVNLKVARERSQGLQKQIYELLDTRFERQQGYDTVPPPTPCDSLYESVSAYMDENEQKDSLQSEVQRSLEAQLAVKDEALLLKTEAYTGLRSAFDSTLTQASALKMENAAITSKFHKQRTKSRILTAVLLFVTGAGTTYLIHH
ncbi:MAG: hypothetical protein EOO15_00285 [Chitinophagaceae bacterium]|nr:MAG: hypothetical protein EOO15_00285 [Chitinophagaceae bacterium]